MADIETLSAKVNEQLASLILRSQIACGELTLEVMPENIREVCLTLRNERCFDFKMLIDVCGVDYLHYGIAEWETESASGSGFERGVDVDAYKKHATPPVVSPPNPPTGENWSDEMIERPKARFAVVYHLLSLDLNHRIRLRVFMDAQHLQVPSVVDIWPAANWFEREAFDLFGIAFVGHPDLRRLLTDYGFIGHPFRKDFPLIGNVEARYDAKLQRVVYEPVSIKPRVLEPKVIRRDNRYQVGE